MAIAFAQCFSIVDKVKKTQTINSHYPCSDLEPCDLARLTTGDGCRWVYLSCLGTRDGLKCDNLLKKSQSLLCRDIYSSHFPPWGGGNFCPN